MSNKLEMLVVTGLALWLTSCSPETAPPRPTASSTGIRFLAEGGAAGHARADAPINFEFPRDHGLHPGFKTEWWYFTGNLLDAGERHFGFELAFFSVCAFTRTGAAGVELGEPPDLDGPYRRD